MKDVQVIVQFVIEMQVSDDTDLQAMERSIEAKPQKFVEESYEPAAPSDRCHVSVEPA